MERKLVIFETDNFVIFVPETPHIDRLDGGHIVIMAKLPNCHTLIAMPDSAAEELICLAKYCGTALTQVLGQSGVDVGIVNYQINGNWSVNRENKDPMHLHVYGRAKTAVHQVYGEALRFPNPDTGFYDGFAPLTDTEAQQIGRHIAAQYAVREG